MEEATKDINRIKVVLVEKKRTNKWLAEQLGKDPATVSKWCTNTSQPGLETLLQIANVLDVDVKDLLHSASVFNFTSVPIALNFVFLRCFLRYAALFRILRPSYHHCLKLAANRLNFIYPDRSHS